MFEKISESRAKYENFPKGENFLRNSHEMFRCFPIIYNGLGGKSLGRVKNLCNVHIFTLLPTTNCEFLSTFQRFHVPEIKHRLWKKINIPRKDFLACYHRSGKANINGGSGGQTFQCDFAGNLHHKSNSSFLLKFAQEEERRMSWWKQSW